jgi:hypothetical protein
VKDGKAVPTEIELSSDAEPEVRADGWVRVLKGLQPGDEVTVENGYALPKDTPVEVLPPKANSEDQNGHKKAQKDTKMEDRRYAALAPVGASEGSQGRKPLGSIAPVFSPGRGDRCETLSPLPGLGSWGGLVQGLAPLATLCRPYRG